MGQVGIIEHVNFGHAVRDSAVADAYLAYWTGLSTDPVAHPLKTRCRPTAATPEAIASCAMMAPGRGFGFSGESPLNRWRTRRVRHEWPNELGRDSAQCLLAWELWSCVDEGAEGLSRVLQLPFRSVRDGRSRTRFPG